MAVRKGDILTVRMTKKIQKLLGIKNLASSVNTEQPSFLDEWYMNYFNINKNWFYIFMETATFYTVVKPLEQIHGSQAFIEYFQRMLIDVINKESNKYELKQFLINEMHLRNTENKASIRIIIDMVYHAEIKKYKKGDYEIFDDLNEIPQALMGYKSPRVAFRENIKKIFENNEYLSLN